jgi:hypothetical protein
VTEKEFLQIVRDLARQTGWLEYHPYDSRRSTPGYPDLTLVRPPRIIFAELKTERGKTTQAQREWLTELARCPQCEVYLWRPSDWDTIGKVLQSLSWSGYCAGCAVETSMKIAHTCDMDDIYGVPT